MNKPSHKHVVILREFSIIPLRKL